MMYVAPAPEESLSQGDILDACPIFGLEVVSVGSVDLDAAPARWRESVVVLTQACDLAQTKTTKSWSPSSSQPSSWWNRGYESPNHPEVRRGLVYGWYFLPAAPAPIPLPESVVDLHDLHTVPRAVLERLIANGKRVCRLLPPYREHLAQHFAVTYMRIGLPAPYETE
jgi:hypothetical protein